VRLASRGVEDPDLFDGFITSITRDFARKTPRRSFFGRIGRLSLASTAGAAAALTLWTESAYAVGCCGSDTTSVGCACAFGTNACPGATCECGCWLACTSNCPSPYATQWCDCCDTAGCNSFCYSGCNNKAKCCFTKEYSGGCGTIGRTIIRCRKYTCVNNPPC
jgi:hypothetical protein